MCMGSIICNGTRRAEWLVASRVVSAKGLRPVVAARWRRKGLAAPHIWAEMHCARSGFVTTIASKTGSRQTSWQSRGSTFVPLCYEQSTLDGCWYSGVVSGRREHYGREYYMSMHYEHYIMLASIMQEHLQVKLQADHYVLVLWLYLTIRVRSMFVVLFTLSVCLDDG